LNGLSAFQKYIADGVARNLTDKSLRVLNDASDLAMKAMHVKGMLSRQHTEFLRVESAVARNIGQHLFRRLSGEASYRSTNHRPKRKNVVMYSHQEDYIAGFAPISRRGSLVRRKVHRVQHITEQFVPLRRKEAEGAVRHPFQRHPITQTFHLGVPLATLDLSPRNLESCLGQRLRIGFSGGF